MSDDSGRLTGFSWTFGRDSAGNRNVNIGMADMGHSSPASSLTPLSPNHLFCASASGDSTLLHLEIPSPGPPSSPTAPSSSPKRRLKGKGKEEVSSPSSIIVSEPSVASSEVMERWINLAPVKDFCAVGDQSGGTVSLPLRAVLMIQSHLVIASGSSNSNSLRVVRSGAGLERVACIEGLEGVERVWSVDLGDGWVA
jgi:DNA damage-binding protein 1